MNGPCMCGAIDCLSCGPAQGYDPLYERYRGGAAWQHEIDDAYHNGAQDDYEAEQLVYERWKEGEK
jgi:hypothetical protein